MYPCGKQIVTLTVSCGKLVLLLHFSSLHIFLDDGKLFKAEGARLKTPPCSGFSPHGALAC